MINIKYTIKIYDIQCGSFRSIYKAFSWEAIYCKVRSVNQVWSEG